MVARVTVLQPTLGILSLCQTMWLEKKLFGFVSKFGLLFTYLECVILPVNDEVCLLYG